MPATLCPTVHKCCARGKTRQQLGNMITSATLPPQCALVVASLLSIDAELKNSYENCLEWLTTSRLLYDRERMWAGVPSYRAPDAVFTVKQVGHLMPGGRRHHDRVEFIQRTATKNPSSADKFIGK